MVHNYDWSSPYTGAVLDATDAKPSERILEAKLAILRRTRESGLARREWQAMEIAMDILRDMRVRRSRCTSISVESNRVDSGDLMIEKTGVARPVRCQKCVEEDSILTNEKRRLD